MYKTITYPIDLKKDDDTYMVTFPDFPEAITYGETKEEALERAVDCLDTALAYRIKDKEEIPSSSSVKVKNKKTITASALMAAKVMLYQEMHRLKVNKAELGRRLHMDKKQIDRMVEPWHKSTLSQLEKAFAALGERLVVSIKAA